MVYSSTENENKVFNYLKSLIGKTVSLSEVKKNVGLIMESDVHDRPYDGWNKIACMSWDNATFYHGAALHGDIHWDNLDTLDVSDVSWSTEVDRNPIYF